MAREAAADEGVRAKQILDAHADNSPLAVIEFDRDFRVIRWAASAERMFGLKTKDVLGKAVDELGWVYEDDLENVRREFASLLDATKPRLRTVNRHYRSDGTVIWCECYASALHDERGDLVSILALVLDITDRKHAEEQARQELETTRTLLAAAGTLASGRSLESVLDALCGAVLQAVEHRRATVSLWDEEMRAIISEASKGDQPFPPGEVVLLEDFTEPGRRAIEERRTAVVDYDAVLPPKGRRHADVPSHLALDVPLVYGDRLVGILTVDDPESRKEFSARDIEITEGIAAQASVAIENARLFEDEQERARLQDALSAVDLAMQSSLEWATVARRALESSAAAVGADAGVVLGREGDEWVAWSDQGFEPSISGFRFGTDSVSRGLIERVQRETVAVDDVRQDPPLSVTASLLGVKSIVGAPLVSRGKTIALVGLAHLRTPHRFTPNEVRFVTQVASALSLGLENARLYETERDISNRLQEALVKLPDRVPGVEFAHAYHSAAEAARVGGDFYALFELPHDGVGIVIGDVAGKGVDAAVLTSLVKNTVQAYAMEGGRTPAEILSLANASVYAVTPPESFATVFFGVLDRSDGRLQYANAGHTTGALVRRRGIVPLGSTGPLLGGFPGVYYESASERLLPEDMLFLYSDGLTEARHDGELYGEERLFEFLPACLKDSPRDLVGQVIDEVVAFTGNRLADDLAILALMLSAAGTEAPRRRELEL